MAAEACFSTCHFAAVYKSHFGCAPYEEILQARAKFAAQALAVSQDSIAQIAHECGYSSQSHMTTQLKRRLGLTPGQIRRRIAA